MDKDNYFELSVYGSAIAVTIISISIGMFVMKFYITK